MIVNKRTLPSLPWIVDFSGALKVLRVWRIECFSWILFFRLLNKIDRSPSYRSQKWTISCWKVTRRGWFGMWQVKGWILKTANACLLLSVWFQIHNSKARDKIQKVPVVFHKFIFHVKYSHACKQPYQDLMTLWTSQTP